MKDGVINKKLSRKMKIKTVYGQDDPRCMEEVIERRIKHSLEKDIKAFGELPDLIIADGGITQIRAIKNAISKCNVQIPVAGLVKDDNHRTRALINESRNEFAISENLMRTLTLFQDTVHDTAISYHRKLRDKEITKSENKNKKGIGKVKKEELLKKFGSIENIKKASLDELMQIKGITKELAEKIKNIIGEK